MPIREGKDGGYRGYIAYRINKIQKALGFPKSELPELDPEWIDGELSKRYSVNRRRTR